MTKKELRKFFKNIEARVLPYSVLILMIVAGLTTMFFVLPPHDLTVSADEEPDSNIDFQSINDLTNNSITYEPISRFNWTRVEDALYYNLQIANDSAFTDIFLNLTNINVTNYPGNYTESTDYVEFTLPEEYRKEWFQKYYIRVRTYTKWTS